MTMRGSPARPTLRLAWQSTNIFRGHGGQKFGRRDMQHGGNVAEVQDRYVLLSALYSAKESFVRIR
jgi:hypothetical protein